MSEHLNEDVAGRLDEVAQLFAAQGANRFRVRAYRRAAETVRRLPQPVSEILERAGVEGLQSLPGIGESIARAIRDLLTHGRLGMLERLRGGSDPATILASVPGIGRKLADRLYHDLAIETLEDLEAAAHDGRLEHVLGFGVKRLAGIRDSLAQRLQRLRPPPDARNGTPSVEQILDVDHEYRDKAAEGLIPRIAPRRFNPSRAAWLPVLHTTRGRRHFTALFSNTALAHRLGRTDDWVVVYWDDGRGERQCTVVTEHRGPLEGRRVVRGREAECLRAARKSARSSFSAFRPRTPMTIRSASLPGQAVPGIAAGAEHQQREIGRRPAPGNFTSSRAKVPRSSTSGAAS